MTAPIARPARPAQMAFQATSFEGWSGDTRGTLHKLGGRWWASIFRDGQETKLGDYRMPAEAMQAIRRELGLVPS